jgi:hypothetical protein
MMRFQLDDLHAVAMNAFNEMETLAVRAKSNTKEFNERQFVFQIGALLTHGAITQGAPLWTGFEYRYPGANDDRERTRCDLVVWEPNTATKGTMGWLEVKSTGLDDAGYWNNAFSGLRWREDFVKLGAIPQQAWQMEHSRAWVWLYQFENYQKKVAAFGMATEWSRPSRPSGHPNAFGAVYAGKVTLQRVLSDIETASGGAVLMSVRPSVQNSLEENPYSAMIVTAMVPSGSNPAPGWRE